MAPHCDAGSCVSCEGRSCPADAIARELEALVCWGAGGAVRSSSAGDDVAQRRLEEDAITALVCSYPSSVPVVGQILEAVRDGRTTVDFAALRTCMEAVQRLSSSATLLSLLYCEGALIGSQTNGGACVGDFDCASSFCMPATSGCIGVCAAQVAVGQPCVADSQCAGAASCAGSVCVADGPSTGAARGESCTYDYQCASPLVCIEATSTCEDVPGDGMPCHDSVLFDCAEGTYCVAGVCRLRSEEGERCPDQVSCVAGTQCAGSPSRCLPVAVNGEVCDASVVCAVGTTCTDGTCQAWPDLGEPCSDVCYRGVCEEGTCVSDRVGRDCSPGLRPFDALDPCGAGATCASGSGGAWYCVATVAAGEACGGDDRCDEPSETCSERDVCEALCSL